MSKTFKCVEHEEEVLEVHSFTGNEAGRRFSLLLPHVSPNEGIAFDSTTAPALALAILEAAGFEDSSTGGHITGARIAVGDLKRHVKMQERATAEAEAQAKLEAEALELFKASGAYGSDRFFLKFSDLEETTQSAWLAVARRAREINKEEK